MKKVLCTICLMLVVAAGGCLNGYYYQPGKTLEECSRDYLECNHGLADSIFRPFCMETRGYSLLFLDEIPAGTRTSQVEVIGLYVAGQ